MGFTGTADQPGARQSQRLALTAPVQHRDEILAAMLQARHAGMDALFLPLLMAQWVLALVTAYALPPRDGSQLHVLIALFGGAALNAAPVTLIILRPGWWGTRHAVAAAQLLWSAMLIMITNGRLETHFHIFGSLAFLALYRDWKVVATASAVIATDLLVRGTSWPASVYGDPGVPWWTFFEHAGWIAFEAGILVVACKRSAADVRAAAARQARLERTASIIERQVQDRTAELHEVAERYRALVENTEAVTFEYDVAERRMRYLSPQAARLLDCTAEDLDDARFLASRLHPDDRVRVRTELAQLATGARPWGEPIDGRLLSRGGRVVHVRGLLNASAGSRRIHGIAIDVTRQREVEAELQRAHRLESVGRLAAGVAHEVNTPIQFVGDSVQFMAQSIEDMLEVVAKQEAIVDAVLAGRPTAELADAAREARAVAVEADLAYIVDQVPKAAERALEGVQRVGTIVRSMKVFAVPSSPDMAPADVNQAIESALTIARSEYRYVANITMSLGALPPVTCHLGDIIQVVLNLVINAAQAISEIHAQTGTRGLISITTMAVDGHAVIEVADTGGGIPEALHDRVFDPFFTTRDVGGGRGQGLPVARSLIVDHHRGSLTFDTTDGYGTTFYIRLPLDVHTAKGALAA